MVVSYFQRIFYKSEKDINIKDAYKLIGNGKLRAITRKIRAETDGEKRKKLKRDNLPAITTSGTFANGTHLIYDLNKHSGFIQIDIDKSLYPKELKEKLSKDKYTNACFLSPSGNGVKVVVKIIPDKNLHYQSFIELENYYTEKYKILIDKKCKDVSRLMYLCSDDNIYINENSEVFKVSQVAELPASKPAKTTIKTTKKKHFVNDTTADVQKVLSQIRTSNIDITDGYNNWLTVGFALADEFGEQGRAYFHEASRNNAGYDSVKCNNQFNACLKNKKNNGISPFFDIARKNGIDTVSVQKEIKQEPEQSTPVNLLNKPLQANSKDPNRDFKDYEFFTKGSCYYTKIMVGKQLKNQRVSNFIMKSLYNLDNGTNNSKRILKIQDKKGNINLVEVQSSEMKKDSLQTILWTNQCSFKGTSYILNSIIEKLIENEARAKEITSIGHQPETNIYSFANAIINENNNIVEINELGVIHDKDEIYYLPAFAPANINNDFYENDRLLKYNNSGIRFKKWSELFYNAYGINGGIGTMYGILSIFRDIVFKQNRYFPFLFLFGDYGTGKTQFTQSILHLFGKINGQDINQTTDTGLSRTVSQRTNSIFYFKEFSNQTDRKIYNFILTAYDGVGKTMGQKTVGNETKNLITKSGIIFDGNYLPVHKSAVYSRLIVLKFEKQNFSDTETNAFNELKEHSKTGFTQITKEILKYRNLFKDNFESVYSSSLENILQSKRLNDLPIRLKEHLALLMTPYLILENELNFPFTLSELQTQIIKYALEQMEVLNDIKDISIFWEAMDYAKNTSLKLKEEKHYLKDKKENIIYIKYNITYSFYVEFCKLNNYNISDKESLRSLLTSEANKTFIKGNRGKTHTKKHLGSCYMFRFTDKDEILKIGNKEINI